ncbi:MAG: hypothetical protein ACOYBL_09625 [Lachnospiraceae bacterium]|jgi:transcriptional regulator with XRE-family HTH domain
MSLGKVIRKYRKIRNLTQEEDRKRAHQLADKQKELARCFEMGKYYEVSSELELAVLEKDGDRVIRVAKEMLSAVEQIGSFRKSSLYAHMGFKEVREEFIAEVKENLRKGFQDDETFDFLKHDERWKELIKQQ